MNGYVVCRTLRAEENWTPVLDAHRQGRRVGSGRGPRHRRRRLPHQALLVRGAARAAARAHPPRRPAPALPSLEVGDLTLDPATRAVRRGGAADRPHDARVRRARVPDAPRGRGRLEGARSSTASGTSRSTATRTSSRSTSRHLRAKIDRPFGRDSIRTMRGAGYRIGGRRWLSAASAPRRRARGSASRITAVAASVVALALRRSAPSRSGSRCAPRCYGQLEAAATQDAVGVRRAGRRRRAGVAARHRRRPVLAGHRPRQRRRGRGERRRRRPRRARRPRRRRARARRSRTDDAAVRRRRPSGRAATGSSSRAAAPRTPRRRSRRSAALLAVVGAAHRRDRRADDLVRGGPGARPGRADAAAGRARCRRPTCRAGSTSPGPRTRSGGSRTR